VKEKEHVIVRFDPFCQLTPEIASDDVAHPTIKQFRADAPKFPITANCCASRRGEEL
jgi:hypothetical protein